MKRAFAKLNLALVVGPLREDRKHEVVSVLTRIDLHDDIALESSGELAVSGFADDTLVRTALESLARVAGVEPHWQAHIEKRIPVAAGLGGGSADAAAALELANATLEEPLAALALHEVARDLGADVPFFLLDGAQLATGDGTTLAPVALPLDFHVVLVHPHANAKQSTAGVYEAFDARAGAEGFEMRAVELRRTLAAVKTPRDLAALPLNDLASSPVASELVELGAFRSDVTGAGPAVYGLFEDADDAGRARDRVSSAGWTTVARPVA
jgi:4-diphosphocytidyl-2-C-methyl-D-erythritol kinase